MFEWLKHRVNFGTHKIIRHGVNSFIMSVSGLQLGGSLQFQQSCTTWHISNVNEKQVCYILESEAMHSCPRLQILQRNLPPQSSGTQTTSCLFLVGILLCSLFDNIHDYTASYPKNSTLHSHMLVNIMCSIEKSDVKKIVRVAFVN
jgi:hypothetical protein